MNINIPNPIKIYHIVHIDRLPSIISKGRLFCDAIIQSWSSSGTMIGMEKIKRRRLRELTLTSHPGLHVGDCVPFYFCPRSVMLYLFYCNNHPELTYRDGQTPIVHLVADMHEAICWADENELRYAFTTSNAGSKYFNDYTDEADLDKINWEAVRARDWQNCREEKQAEFLIERQFPWELVREIGVYSEEQLQPLSCILATVAHRPPIAVERNWYY